MLCTAQMQIYQVRRYCKDWKFLKKIILKFLFKSRKLFEISYNQLIICKTLNWRIGLKRFTRI